VRGKPKGTRTYHALTRRWTANEVVVRADPKDRTIGEFLAEEIAGPLGCGGDAYIGLCESERRRTADLIPASNGWASRIGETD
jgi:hypothetical protein